MKTRVLIVDDHVVMAEGLSLLLSREPDMEVVGQIQDGLTAVTKAAELIPDVVIMDISLPELSGIEATKKILSEHPQIKVLALSNYDDWKHVSEMMEAGALGYLRKDIAYKELVSAIKSILEGKIYLSSPVAGVMVKQHLSSVSIKDPLTPREREVLKLIADGKSTKEIAFQLEINIKTVETHRKNIMEKLNLHSTAELTKYAIKLGMSSL